MKNVITILIICLISLGFTSTSFAQKIKVYGHKGSLMVKNITEESNVHVFMCVTSTDCGSADACKNDVLIEGVDYTNQKGYTTHYDSFYRKIADWRHMYLSAGEKRIVVPANCHGSINYQFKATSFILSAKQWEFIKNKMATTNLNSQWAK